MATSPPVPVGNRRERYLVILVGVIAGYAVGRLLETRLGWMGAGMVTMPVGGLLAGVVARFTLVRFREPPVH
jgi:hypothetical protein